MDLASGTERWSVDTGAPITAAPAISGGVAYVPAGATLGAYDTASGSTVWSAPIDASESGGTTVVPSDAGGSLVLVGDDSGVLHAVDPTGTAIWRVNVADTSLARWPSTVVDGVIYASGQDGTLSALGAQATTSGTPAPTPATAVATHPGGLTLPARKGGAAPTPALVPTPTLAPTSLPTPLPTPVATAPIAYADAGMVEPGHYVSPNTGVEVRWNIAGWELDPFLGAPVASAYDMDELHLVWSQDNNIFMGVFIYPSYGNSLEGLIDYVSSSQNVTEVIGPNAVVVLSTATPPHGACVVRDEGGGFVPWMIYSEFYLVNDGAAIVEVTLYAPVPLAEQVLTAAQGQVTLNGQPVMTYYPIPDVVAAVGP